MRDPIAPKVTAAAAYKSDPGKGRFQSHNALHFPFIFFSLGYIAVTLASGVSVINTHVGFKEEDYQSQVLI